MNGGRRAILARVRAGAGCLPARRLAEPTISLSFGIPGFTTTLGMFLHAAQPVPRDLRGSQIADKVRVLVVGLGNIGGPHMRVPIIAIRLEIVRLMNRSIKGKASPDELKGYPLFEDFDEVLRVTKPNAVSINSRPNSHTEYAIKAMNAGARVFMEKADRHHQRGCRSRRRAGPRASWYSAIFLARRVCRWRLAGSRQKAMEMAPRQTHTSQTQKSQGSTGGIAINRTSISPTIQIVTGHV